MSPLAKALHSRSRSAFSLVEVMLAVAILAIGTTATVSTMVFSSQQSRLNSNALAAKNIAQGYFERMTIDAFDDINAANYPDISWPDQPYDLDDPNAVWLDRALLMPCRVDFEFKGFGDIESGSTSALTDNDANWMINEWQGDTLFIVDGRGAGQFVDIASNTANTLTFEDSIAFSPSNGSRYMINNGKTVEITTTWEYRGKIYRQRIESLISNFRNSEDLGF